MNDVELDVLLNDVLIEAANPTVPHGLERRILEQTGAAMSVTTLQEKVVVPEFVGTAREQGLLVSLWSGLRELISRPKLPELALESRPMPVRTTWDQISGGGSSRSTWGAVALHALAILLIGFLAARKAGLVQTPHEIDLQMAHLTPPPMPAKDHTTGGGGGQHGPAPVSKGELPKVADEQITPPKAPPLDQPKLAVEPTVVAQADLKMAKSDVPQLGMPNSPLAGSSMGNGLGGGIGSGYGNGIGPGSGGNIGGGIYRIGGGVSAPVVLFQPEPEFSEEARRARAAGNVLVSLIVDEHGNVRNVHVLRGIGLGLDEKAVAAVRQYRFKPAMKGGKPVAVEMNVDVSFSIF